MAEPFTIYKLTILAMLDRVDYPLSNAQIANFFLLQEYTTDYFKIQQGLSDLQDAGLVRVRASRRNTQYVITAAGRETLALLGDKVSEGIETDIINYFQENGMDFQNDNAVIADYYRTPNHDYAVRCQYRKKNCSLIDLTLTVKKKEQAEAICGNWKKQNGDVYTYLMDLLLK